MITITSPREGITLSGYLTLRCPLLRLLVR
nr:MAG TPA: hypothetical protein [Caudoviricetes sp.]